MCPRARRVSGRRKKPKSRRSRSRGRFRLRSRPLAAAAAVLFVALAGGILHLYVVVTSRFEGRLWQIPSKIYSSSLELRPGLLLSPDGVTRRLERSGYGRSEGTPSDPGQYRRSVDTLEIRARAFEGARDRPPGTTVVVRFDEGRIRSVRDESGRWLGRVEIEPELLATLFGPRQEDRQVVHLEDVPPMLVDAVLAAEDARFFSHGGIDVRAVARAALANVRRGGIVQGGSTITQQTVKNLFLGPERTWWRKAREALMSVLLDLRYDKPRILEAYLNEVYLGQRGSVAVCGVQAASRFYFGRDLDELTLGDAAMLAGMIRSPGRYNPFNDPRATIERRDQVLAAMLRLEMIDEAALEQARAEQPRLGSGGGGFRGAPWVADYVRAQLGVHYSRRLLEGEGLNIYTTIDTVLQEAAEKSVERGLEILEHRVPAVREQRGERRLQGALVVTRPETGEVLALVGGRNYEDSQFNRAVQAKRQPGSCFKPFVYAAAFEKRIRTRRGGLTPASILEDAPIELVSGGKRWTPANYDETYRGEVSARQALEESLNVPTVRAARQTGLDEVIDLARRAGIGSPLREVPSLALGTMEVTPLELAAAYGTLANLGRRVTPRVIREVRDVEGKPLERHELERAQTIDPRAAYLVTHVLEGVFERGTARSAEQRGFHGKAAGKTGTTDETRDSWFVGYTPELLALVWVGYDDNARTGLTGATGALPLWVDFMRRAGLADSRRGFAQPAGIIRRTIDPATGELATARCPESRTELFAAGTEPRDGCQAHGGKRGGFFRRLFRRDD